MMRQTLQPSLVAGANGRTILIAGGERGVIYDGRMFGLSWDVWRKAQQYGVWKEVLQWAKAHPLAVPFVNQDTDMIHSIADTGWTRWITTDGVSWAKLESLTLSKGSTYETKVMWSNVTYDRKIFVGSKWQVASIDGGKFYVIDSSYKTAGTPKANTLYTIRIEATDTSTKYYVNNSLLNNGAATINDTGPSYAFIGGDLNRGRGATSGSRFYYLKKDEVPIVVPCKLADGTIGLVDAENGTFYPNANTTGSFTIELTQDNQ